jgi:hypothetical protein
MNKNINALCRLKLLLIVLFSFFLFASCKKAEVEKPENVCTLTAEQIPDVRGFQLGMPYDVIKERFPSICNYSNDAKITIKPYKGSAENTPNIVSNCESVNVENYPELEGITDKTTDESFRYTFQNKTEELLGTNKFTNWEYVTNILEPNRKAVELEGKMLTCNKVFISIGTTKDTSTSHYKPFLMIGKTNDTAITKAQQEQEKRDAQDQKKAKDQKKREEFKP